MVYKASITFEYDLQAPETHRTQIEVPNASLGARRAMEAARRAYPRRSWRSAVIVLEALEGANQ